MESYMIMQYIKNRWKEWRMQERLGILLLACSSTYGGWLVGNNPKLLKSMILGGVWGIFGVMLANYIRKKHVIRRMKRDTHGPEKR